MQDRTQAFQVLYSYCMKNQIAETDGVDLETGFLAVLVSSVSDQNHLPNAETSSCTCDRNGVVKAMLESLAVVCYSVQCIMLYLYR